MSPVIDESESGPTDVIRRFYLYKATVSTGVITPIFTLFLLFRELTYTEIATLSMVYAVLTVVGEIPTGYIGDRIGRRNSLVLSSLAMVASIAGFVVVQTYLGLLVLYVLWAIALVFRSGSDDAWLFDTLQTASQEGTFTAVRGRGVSIQRGVTVVGMLVGGVLFSVDPRLPFVVSGVLNAISIPVLFSLPKNRQFDRQTVGSGAAERSGDREDGGEDPETPEDTGLTMGEAVTSIRVVLSNPGVAGILALVAVFIGVAGATNTYIQPIVVGPLAFPESILGPLYAGFTAVAAVAAYLSGWVDATLGPKATLMAAPFLLGAVLLLPLIAPILALPAFVLMRSGRPLVASIASGYLNEHTGSAGRATVLSAASMLYAGAKLPFYLFGGVVADAISPVVAVGALGAGAITVAVLGLALWAVLSPDIAGSAGVSQGSE